MKLGKSIPSSRSTSTSSPQGCVLFPLLFFLYTTTCVSIHSLVKLLKFADDTTLVGLISKEDESDYRREIEWLRSWCNCNNLELNALKTVEMVVDVRRSAAPPRLIMLEGTQVKAIESDKFRGITVSRDLKWNITSRPS